VFTECGLSSSGQCWNDSFYVGDVGNKEYQVIKAIYAKKKCCTK